ncbi:MAG: hypothetical protein A2600_00250 [Candidatus Lambdaproteobacteria bacterium RIFOXYD1_FULL_56_27]|uniref:diguanylate cyclase n=1 Tax=Candidatus Lambdaproteobacteria bacterium RIFOXYD2_FULL_56_26 TaxID=1817773 RepID=A0A1F6GPI6_9PROT|nr:MAG: hypothetical protein A2557_04370 [Candidatus Lambdaproteobacteria bacterium RIFOXYD2_FULL_56_26]OGH03948.1 MAG: hypothetical protein A2426_07595 [Candidatus Lambdaproteobacteria bacterium RIFOXYC1_FULL_56_13]OGH06205.1 MAG: hypothetical protein A2600_00250 [Candidatus Lambdaproteobacteria bacterium RIFOXYD1_FULL_56_27]
MNELNEGLPVQLLELIGSVQDPMLLFSATGKLLWANKPFCRLVGRKEETLLGRSLSQTVEAGTEQIFDRHLGEVLAGEHTPVSFPIRSALDGAHLLVNCSFSHLKHQGFAYIMVRADPELTNPDQFLQFDEATYKELLNSVQSGVVILEEDRIRYANAYFCELCGYLESELLGHHFFELLHPDDVQSFAANYQTTNDGGLGDNEYEFRIKQKDGLVIYVFMVVGDIRLGGRKARVASVQNVTMRMLVEEEKQSYFRQLQDQLEYVDNLIERLPLGAWIIDFHAASEKDTNAQFCSLLYRDLGFSISIRRTNLALCQMLGYSKEEMRGRSILDPMFVDDQNAKIFLDAIMKRRLGERGSYEITMRHKDNHDIPVLLEAIPTIFDPENGEAIQSIGLMVDLTERKAWEAELQRLNEKLMEYSKTDSLTGLANRRSFDEYINQERARAIREKWDLSLVIIDIDFFKKYNDGYGHLKGDDCLRKVAAVFKRSVKRAIDLVTRYGGEEFAVVLPSTSTEGAFQVAENLRIAVAEAQIPHLFSSVAPHVTISVGVATLRAGEAITVDRLIVLADEALYQSKTEGRNRVTKALRSGGERATPAEQH